MINPVQNPCKAVNSIPRPLEFLWGLKAPPKGLVMNFIKQTFSYSILCFMGLSTIPIFAQNLADLSQSEGFETPAPVFAPSSELSYDRTNLKPEGNLTLGLWFSQAEALSISLGIEQDKLFGTDEAFRLNLEASSFTQTAQITLTDPDFFESVYSRQLSFSTYNIQPNRSQNGAYSFSGSEASIGFGRQLTQELSFSFGAGVGKSRIDNDPNLPTFIQNYVTLEGQDQTTHFGFLNFVYDRTDRSPYPQTGYRLGFATELGLVGDTTYLKSEIKGSYFAQAGARTGVKIHGNVGLGSAIGTGTYPVYENFSAGGPGSVRGYAQNTLGPTSTIPGQTSLAQAGGKLRVTGGIEMATRIGDRDDLHVLGFYDFGNAFAQVGDLNSSELRSSVGVGVRWDTPIGPLNVYLSKALNDKLGDNLEVLQFTLGASF
jgi:outer membrane protein assembly complex protein YaeT